MEKETKDYYKVLEIKKTATDTEIKQAYIKFKNIYNPNNYEKDNLKQIAIKKTQEIETAFEAIMNKRRLERIQKGKSAADEPNSNTSNNNSYSGQTTKNVDLTHVEQLINNNELDTAQNLLNSINENERPAHWFYLKGLILLKKGWLEEAANFFSAALRMNPTNRTYAEALKRINWQRNGGFESFDGRTPHGAPYPQATSCTFCDSCMGMMCANALCSCCDNNAMGGC